MSTTRKIMGLAAATGLGAYWLSGKEGRRRREELLGSLSRIKAGLLDRLEGFERSNRDTYRRLADQFSQRYATLKRVNSRELKELAADIQEAWRSIRWRASAGEAAPEAGRTEEEARGEEEREPEPAGERFPL